MAPPPNPIKVTLNGNEVQAQAGQSILELCRKEGVELPVMCYLEGLSKVGACRMCLVELEGSPKLFPACTTAVVAGQKIRTDTDKLKKYRRMTTELIFAERNHYCAVCVANGTCDLQNMAKTVGMTYVRFPYLLQDCHLDATHPEYVIDHNRCILCTRCVRVCDEIEGAHNWDVMGRGHSSRVIADFNQPWGESVTCTSCGKCVQVCPTGALWPKDSEQGTLKKTPGKISELAAKRKAVTP